MSTLAKIAKVAKVARVAKVAKVAKIALIMSQAACGIADHNSQYCGGDLKELCHNILGGRADQRQDDSLDQIDTDLDRINRDLELIKAKIAELESANSYLLLSLNQYETALNSTRGQLAALEALVNTLPAEADINAIEALIEQLASQANLIQDRIDNPVTGLSTLVNQNTAAIYQLQNNHNISKIIDPCGDAPGIYDEVFLKTSSGKIVASFSDNQNGKNTRFSELVPGTYQTTDGSGCVFTVSTSLGNLVVTPSTEH